MSSGPSVIDLFAGAGGFSTGLSWAGFDIQWAIDDDEECRKTFGKNHPGVEFACRDIRAVDAFDIEFPEDEIDLIVGGPPCPTFSRIGRGKIKSQQTGPAYDGGTGPDFEGSEFQDSRPSDVGEHVLKDERHHLFEEYVRFVSDLHPDVFVMENVPGMRLAETRTGEIVVDQIKRRLREEGYRISSQVLDAVNFGVPQHRERLFLIGNCLGQKNPVVSDWATHRPPLNARERRVKTTNRPEDDQQTLVEFGLETDKPFRSFVRDRDRKEPWITVGDALLDLPPVSPEGNMPPNKASKYTVPPVSKYQEWVRPRESNWQNQELYNHECRNHNLTDLTLYKILGSGVGWIIDDLDEQFHPYRPDVFKDQYKKENPQEPASTVNAHIEKDGHMSIHPREARSFTVREAARLQSFQDDYRFPVARTNAYAQIGNAVPPLLAEALGTAIRDTLLKSSTPHSG